MPGENEFDLDAALTEVSDGLGFGTDTGGSDDVVLDIPEGAADAVAASADTTVPAVDTPAEPAAADPSLEPPKTWRKEATAAWTTLPAEVRQEVLKREEDMFKGLESYKADAGFGKNFKTALEPFMPILQQYNIDPVQQVRGLMSAHYTLATGSPEQKIALFQKLAGDYGVDLTNVSGENAPFTDPAVAALQNQLKAVESKLSTAEATRAAEAQAVLVKQIDAFAADPANPYFNDVANDMTTLLQKGVCSTLQEAYDKAVWTNPVIRAKEMQRQQAEASQKAAEAAATKAAAARKASSANVRVSAKSGSAAAPLGSIDDTLAATLAEINSRG